MKRILTILCLLGPCAAFAGEGYDHGHSHDTIAVPATVPEITTAIGAKKTDLAAALAARDAAAAHAATDTLSTLVKAIPAKLAGADEAARQRIAGMANNAAKAWSQAAHQAEDGDFAKAGREAAKAEAAYSLIGASLRESAGQPGN